MSTTTLHTLVTGPVIGPQDVEYEDARRVYNFMIDARPNAIVRCADAKDVQAAVAHAVATGHDVLAFDIGTRTLSVVSTPGHTRGHVVFADAAAGLLFAGDHVLPHITPSIGFQEAPSAEPLREYLQSLNVVRRLPDMQLLPAHGPVSPSTHSRIDELTEHHAERLRLMAGVLSTGQCTGYDVALAIGWTRRQLKLADLDLMNQMLAICETVYHLDLLVAQAVAVSQVADDGIRRYGLSTPAP